VKLSPKFAIFAVAMSLTITSAAATHKTVSTSDPASYVVDIRDFAFSPRTLVISVGSKVTWKNEDEEPHKLAETNHAFMSPPLDTGEGFAYEFRTVGKYEYFCTIHPHMTGEIIVESK